MYWSKKILINIFFAVLAVAFFFGVRGALAAVTITTSTGGDAISADTNIANGITTWTTLVGPIITEGVTGDIGLGTIVINAPSGFNFSTTSSVTATRTNFSGSCAASKSLQINGSTSQTVTPTASTIIITITRPTTGTCLAQIIWTGILVRPIVGTPLSSGNLTNSGTSVINGAAAGSNFGTLTEVAGLKNKLVYTTQPTTTAVPNVDFATKPVVALEDQFGNIELLDNTSIISLSPVLSDQGCGGTVGAGALTSTPASGAAVAGGVMTYTAMQYSSSETIKICATSASVTSDLSSAIVVSTNIPVPIITSVLPISTTAGGAQFTLTVNGTNFVSSSTVYFNGLTRTTTFVSSVQLTAIILASDIATTGTASITVFNPAPGGGTSNSQTLIINDSTATSSVPTSPTIVQTPIGVSSAPAFASFGGQAYPGGTIEILRKTSVDASYESIPFTVIRIDRDGVFTIMLSNFLQADYFFALRATDMTGRSSLVSFPAFFVSGSNFVVNNIIFPPTFSVPQVAISQGKNIVFTGIAAPGATVFIEINGAVAAGVVAAADGSFGFTTSTMSFAPGTYRVRAKQQMQNGATSDFSPAQDFKITKLQLPQADFDRNGVVDIKDWSIFLFNWNTTSTTVHKKNDMNGDGRVDVQDLSIFLSTFKNK